MKRGRGNPVRLLRSCAVAVAKMDRACPARLSPYTQTTMNFWRTVIFITASLHKVVNNLLTIMPLRRDE
jgi:hypothetical protein